MSAFLNQVRSNANHTGGLCASDLLFYEFNVRCVALSHSGNVLQMKYCRFQRFYVYYFLVSENGGLRMERYVSRDVSLNVAFFKWLQTILSRDFEIECVLHNYQEGDENTFPCQLIPQYRWSYWKTFYPHAAKHYERVLHPLVIQKVQQNVWREHIDGTLLDVGCGDGALAHKLMEQRKFKNVYLLDECESALKHFPQMDGVHCIVCDLSYTNLSRLVPVSCTLIICCGILAHRVVSYATALRTLQQCYRLLAHEGVMIVTSHSIPHFNSEDYRAVGFHVVSCCEFFQEQWVPFYVLQKQCTA